MKRNIGKHWFSPYLQATIENYIVDSRWHPHSRMTKPERGRLGVHQGTQKEAGRDASNRPFPNNVAHPTALKVRGEEVAAGSGTCIFELSDETVYPSDIEQVASAPGDTSQTTWWADLAYTPPQTTLLMGLHDQRRHYPHYPKPCM